MCIRFSVNLQLHVYLVMEVLGGGELLERLRRESGLTEARASSIFLQLVHAVQAMHSKRVVHRDLKPEVCSGAPVVSASLKFSSPPYLVSVCLYV